MKSIFVRKANSVRVKTTAAQIPTAIRTYAEIFRIFSLKGWLSPAIQATGRQDLQTERAASTGEGCVEPLDFNRNTPEKKKDFKKLLKY